jgi:hypothetical protein
MKKLIVVVIALFIVVANTSVSASIFSKDWGDWLEPKDETSPPGYWDTNFIAWQRTMPWYNIPGYWGIKEWTIFEDDWWDWKW